MGWGWAEAYGGIKWVTDSGKGKSNHQWDLREVFALRKSGQKADEGSLQAIKNSFAGKLLLHALTFRTACREVTFLTNVQFNDDVLEAVQEIQSGKPTSKRICFLIENLGGIFEEPLGNDAAIAIAKKLSFLANVKYIGDTEKTFAVEAREAIFQYSEVDLTRDEATKIASGLLAMVQRKSMASIEGMTPEKLDDSAGIGLQDLLSILSVTPRTGRGRRSQASPHSVFSATTALRYWGCRKHGRVCNASEGRLGYMAAQFAPHLPGIAPEFSAPNNYRDSHQVDAF